MVGDYISTSFNDAGTAATVFAIGNAAHRQRVRRGHVGTDEPAAGGERRRGHP